MMLLRLRLRLLLLLVVVGPITISAKDREYYPCKCDERDYRGTTCVLTCSGTDACDRDDLAIPESRTVTSFIVRCVNGNPACNSLDSFIKRAGLDIYLMCIDSCNSADEAQASATYAYCGKCNSIKSKGVRETTTINGVRVVVFDNGVAVGRDENPRQEYMGIISNGPRQCP